MKKQKMTAQNSDLPEPIALTPDQLKEIASKTAGGLVTVPHSIVIIAGGLPAGPKYT
jgi:hypothetical protein